MLSINSFLTSKANDYFIKYGSDERTKINNSIDSLKKKLNNYFGSNILSIEEFGSYKRGTILPRQYDITSDIDILIIFDHARLKYQPGTYRNNLKRFAEDNYSRSEIYKDSPTVVIDLNHIKYDLVPCHIETLSFFPDQYYIPRNDTEWMSSDIHGFNTRLTEANTKYNSVVKPIIRLLKAWNAKVNYPILSYTLEQEIAGMNFNNNTIETGFFFAIGQLSSYRTTTYASDKVTGLKDNLQRVKSNLDNDKYDAAISWLGHILPI